MGNTLELLELLIQDTRTKNPRLIGWNSLGQAVLDAQSRHAQQEVLVQHFKSCYPSLENRSSHSVYRRLKNAFASAHENISRIMGTKVVPFEMARHLSLLPLPDDPVELFKIGFLPNPKPPATIDRRQFEARRIIELGCEFFDLGMVRMTAVQQPLEWITKYLVNRGILESKPQRQPFATWHDRSDELRYRAISFPGDGVLRFKKAQYTHIKHHMCVGSVATPDQNVRVLYQVRAKDRMSILRKMVALGKDLAQHTPDILALRIICFTSDDRDLLSTVVLERLPAGSIIEYKDRRKRGAPSKNPFSAPDYQDIELRIRIVDSTGTPRICELQLLTAEIHFNVEYSATAMNHRRYEARQLLAKLQPMLAPYKIYGVPWDDPEIQPKIEQHIARDVMRQRR